MSSQGQQTISQRGGGTKGRGRGRGRGGSRGRGGRGRGGVEEPRQTSREHIPRNEKNNRPPNKNKLQTVSRTNPSSHSLFRKVIMRNIPCTITYSEITSFIESRGFPVTFVWHFVQGVEAANNRPSRLGRLYLDFQKDQDLAKAFVASTNGCSIGECHEVKIQVGFAPFQKVSRAKPRKDPKSGTISKDPDYLAFLQAMSNPKERVQPEVSIESVISQSSEKPVALLVQYLNEKRSKGKGKLGKLSKAERRSSKKKEKSTKASFSTKSTRQGNSGENGKRSAKQSRKKQGNKKNSDLQKDSSHPGAIRIMITKTPDAVADLSTNLDGSSKLAQKAKSKRNSQRQAYRAVSGGDSEASSNRSKPKNSKRESQG